MKISASLASIGTLLIIPLLAHAQDSAFGTEENRNFGDSLWNTLEAQTLVGDGAISAKPYEGTDPHGSILVTLESEVAVEGERGTVIIKRNYMGDGVTVESVSNNPRENLMATTVMFQREGFDPDHNNWFWAKYMPDGSYDTAPNGAVMAGAVKGCISCHQDADGEDMVFLNNRH